MIVRKLIVLKIIFFLSSSALLADSHARIEQQNEEHSYTYPLMDARLSSKFGKRKHPIRKVFRHHHGIDLAAPYSAPIRAIAAGTVVYSDIYAGYGNVVVILHANGMTSHYGHNRANIVQPGEKIKAGQIIAEVGSTGLSTGPHLHYEFLVNGVHRNPRTILNKLPTAKPVPKEERERFQQQLADLQQQYDFQVATLDSYE